MFYLSIEDIRICHDNILKYSLHAINKKQGFLTEIDKLQNTTGEINDSLEIILENFLHPYEKEYSPCTRVSRFIYDICQLHPFMEGNKRTAYFLSSVLLASNGLKLRAPSKEVEWFFTEIAKGNKSPKEIKKWLQKNCSIYVLRAWPIYLGQMMSILILKQRDINLSDIGGIERQERVYVPLVKGFVTHIIGEIGEYPESNNNKNNTES